MLKSPSSAIKPPSSGCARTFAGQCYCNRSCTPSVMHVSADPAFRARRRTAAQSLPRLLQVAPNVSLQASNMGLCITWLTSQPTGRIRRDLALSPLSARRVSRAWCYSNPGAVPARKWVLTVMSSMTAAAPPVATRRYQPFPPPPMECTSQVSPNLDATA